MLAMLILGTRLVKRSRNVNSGRVRSLKKLFLQVSSGALEKYWTNIWKDIGSAAN